LLRGVEVVEGSCYRISRVVEVVEGRWDKMFRVGQVVEGRWNMTFKVVEVAEVVEVVEVADVAEVVEDVWGYMGQDLAVEVAERSWYGMSWVAEVDELVLGQMVEDVKGRLG
jgi:hypothetical protein